MTVAVKRIWKSDEEWSKEISPLLFHVTRRGGTDRPFLNEYCFLRDSGIYVCACCGNALFSSADRIEAGEGYPVFARPVSEDNIFCGQDAGLVIPRKRPGCARCFASLGHVDHNGGGNVKYVINPTALCFVKISGEKTW